MTDSVLVIDLSARESECCACGTAVLDPRKGLPMYEGEIVPADYEGEWSGFDACDECHSAYETAGPEGVAIRVRALNR
jgi:hypothetical protein